MIFGVYSRGVEPWPSLYIFTNDVVQILRYPRPVSAFIYFLDEGNAMYLKTVCNGALWIYLFAYSLALKCFNQCPGLFQVFTKHCRHYFLFLAVPKFLCVLIFWSSQTKLCIFFMV